MANSSPCIPSEARSTAYPCWRRPLANAWARSASSSTTSNLIDSLAFLIARGAVIQLNEIVRQSHKGYSPALRPLPVYFISLHHLAPLPLLGQSIASGFQEIYRDL